MKKTFTYRLTAGTLLCLSINACSTPVCEEAVVAKAPAGLRIEAGGERKQIGAEFFGFNLESAEFQLSLWDPASRRVRPEIMQALSAFEGATYRFPGGTTANYYRWKEGTGSPADRKSARIVDWTVLPRIDFGLDEYLDFVGKVGGRAWYVLNLQGSLGEPAAPETLAGEAAALASRLKERRAGIMRWELGNELDRANDMWPSSKYLAHARAVLAGVRSADPDARFVGMMADFDAQKSRGVTASDYNLAVAEGLKPLGVVEYEQHLYYDGGRDGPPVPNRLRQLCRSIQDARKAGTDAERLAFWVTEHARWPEPNPGEEWKRAWRKSADLDAAISMADFLIALTQITGVRGAALHSLHGTDGPWPLFHRVPAAGGAAAAYVPSVTMHAYRMLRESLLPVVLASKSASAARSGYDGGYDARGAVLTTPGRDRFSVWTVNRDAQELAVTLSIPALAGRTVAAELHELSAGEAGAHNYVRADTVLPRRSARTIEFDSRGVATYPVAARSVAALVF